MKNQSQNNYTTYQLKLPVDLERIIEISDPVYTFCEVMDYIDLNIQLGVCDEYIAVFDVKQYASDIQENH